MCNVNVCKLLSMTVKIKNNKTYKNQDLTIFIQKNIINLENYIYVYTSLYDRSLSIKK